MASYTASISVIKNWLSSFCSKEDKIISYGGYLDGAYNLSERRLTSPKTAENSGGKIQPVPSQGIQVWTGKKEEVGILG